MAYALGLAHQVGHETPWPDDAIVVSSFGDASANHSTALGALNAASYLTQREVTCPILFVCEDNRIGISTRSPRQWPGLMLESIPGVRYLHADGAEPLTLLEYAALAARLVREDRRPVILHLDMVRFLGHAGSDAEIAYRSQTEILSDYEKDPLLATAQCLLAGGHASPEDVLRDYEAMRTRVMDEARRVLDEPHLNDCAEVTDPLTLPTVSPRNPGPSRRTDGEAEGQRGVSEAVVTGLLENGYRGRISRVASADTFIPLGPAASAILLSEEDIVAGSMCAAMRSDADSPLPGPGRTGSPDSG